MKSGTFLSELLPLERKSLVRSDRCEYSRSDAVSLLNIVGISEVTVMPLCNVVRATYLVHPSFSCGAVLHTFNRPIYFCLCTVWLLFDFMLYLPFHFINSKIMTPKSFLVIYAMHSCAHLASCAIFYLFDLDTAVAAVLFYFAFFNFYSRVAFSQSCFDLLVACW